MRDRTCHPTLHQTLYGFPIQVENRGEVQPNTPTTGDEQCTTNTYADATGARMIGVVVQTRTTTGLCATAASAGPDQVVADQRTYYDNLPLGQAPIRGDATSVETINGSGTGYTRTTATVYDMYGRATTVTNADGKDTVTVYTPGDNNTPTRIEVTNPLGHKTTTTSETGRGLALTASDANNSTISTAYDPVGRLTDMWSASRQGQGISPTVHYRYAISGARPTVVTTETLRDNGTYAVSKTFYDGLLRPRQTQGEAVGTGRVITDIFYNTSGTERRVNSAYYTAGEPDDVIFVPATTTQVRSWTETSRDGLGRPTSSELWYAGAATPERTTKTVHEGEVTTVTPPPGGTATRTTTDAFGRTVTLEQLDGSTWNPTRYEYDIRGDRTKAIDAAGNTWTWTYDARKQLIRMDDPDKGLTSFTYDNAGRETVSTDARGNTLATTYDALGRKTTLRSSDINGPKLAEWTYDTTPGGIGLPAKSIRYDNGSAYTSEVTAYDSDYHRLATKVTIPESEGLLQGEYVTSQTFTPTGKVAETTLPDAGPLRAEKVITRYNSDGLPLSTSGKDWYTSDTVYSPYGEVLRTQSGTAPLRLWTTNTYDEHTGRLLSAATHREAGTHFVGETRYSYDKADNVSGIISRTADNTGSESTDRQCFAYDTLRRTTQAWTSTQPCPEAPAVNPGSNYGGPDAYWTSYTFDAVGNRTTETVHDPAGNTANDISRTYTYSQNAKAKNTHQLTQVTATGPGETGGSYTYDAAGNTRTRRTSAGTQTLSWNAEGHLERVEGPASATTYLYDTTGARFLSRTTGITGQSATLYLGNTEITASGSTVTADRYYLHPGAPTTIRTSSGNAVTHLVSDQQGTATTAIASAPGMSIRIRKTSPYGEIRRTSVDAWPGTKGFVGGTIDPTGLTHLGAREYDPEIGRFVSVDPVMDLADPQQMHGYSYAASNPATLADPTGLHACEGENFALNMDNPDGNWCSPGGWDGNGPPPPPNAPPKKPKAAIPQVDNERLQKIVNDSYVKPDVTDWIEEGRAYQALEYELLSGNKVGTAEFHAVDNAELLARYTKLLRDYRRGKVVLSELDLKVATEESKVLWGALNKPDVAGKVTEDLQSNAKKLASFKGAVKNTVEEPAMKMVTGAKFEDLPHNKVRMSSAPRISGMMATLGLVGDVALILGVIVDVFQGDMDKYQWNLDCMMDEARCTTYWT